MAAMDAAKKMMEKWGWSKGQGLGKDNKGMTSCLVLRKNDGSANQGRIEMSAPVADIVPKAENFSEPTADPALLAAFYASVGMTPQEGPANKLARTAGAADVVGAGSHDGAAMVMDVTEDPDVLIAKYGGSNPDAMVAQYGAPRIVASPATVAAQGQAQGTTIDWTPKPRKRGPKQWVYDDWRWSKGTEALRCFEEMQLPSELKELAVKVLGENSRFPGRIADDTDCIVQLTAWGTVILRPRGTGADINLAKRMLFQVMHPSQDGLRDDIMIEEDEDAEAAINDTSQLLDGLGDTKIEKDRLKSAVERNKKGKMQKVGLGADTEATADTDSSKMDTREIPLPTSEDIAIVRKHLYDLRVATGVNASISGGNLNLSGKESGLDRALLLIITLMETGEWVALADTFRLSEQTKKEKRQDDGPVEQILIKVPEGLATQMIGKHLQAMERAADAQQLKLSSKPIGGKRTLMVEGTRAAHERVKLMAKELSATGESPMLTKHLAGFRRPEKPKDVVDVECFSASFTPGRRVDIPGVISAGPTIKNEPSDAPIKIEPKEEPVDENETPSTSTGSQAAPAAAKSMPAPAAPAMRRMPGPKLAVDMAAGNALFSSLPAAGPAAPLGKIDDLFAGLPPDVSVASTDSAAAATSASDSATATTPAFPPVPPTSASTAEFSALDAAFPPVPPGGVPKPLSKDAVEAAEQELIDFIGGVTE